MGIKSVFESYKSPLLIVSIALFMVVVYSCLQYGTQCLSNAAFTIGVGYSREREAIIATIRQYNSTTSGLYATGGYVEEFRIMPADNLLKRKHFQNVDQLKRDHVVIVFDLDQFSPKQVRFYGRDLACVVTSELWAMVFQNMDTRAKLSNVKGESLNVRYMMHRRQGRWVVAEVEVFPRSEPVTAPDKSPQ